MSEKLKEELIDLGLQRSYVSALLNAGYDDWDIISEITESDFDVLNIRLGDRRKLQREIARRQLWPENSPLPTSNELRDFTLSLQGNSTPDGETKNGFFQPHVVESIECDYMSSDTADRPAESDFDATGKGSGSMAGTMQSSDTIPSSELDAQTKDEAMEGNALNHLAPVSDMLFDDNDTPRATETAL